MAPACLLLVARAEGGGRRAGGRGVMTYDLRALQERTGAAIWGAIGPMCLEWHSPRMGGRDKLQKRLPWGGVGGGALFSREEADDFGTRASVLAGAGGRKRRSLDFKLFLPEPSASSRGICTTVAAKV